MKLIRGHNIQVEVKAASALEALAQDNYGSQSVFLTDKLDSPKALMKLLKVIFKAGFITKLVKKL